MLKEAGFDMVRVEQGTYACIELPSEEADKLFNSVLEEWRREDKDQVIIQPEDKHIDWDHVEQVVRDAFKRFPSQQPHIQVALDMLRARNNVLLIGPPGSGKSMFLDMLMSVLDTVYINMANTTNAGLENILPRLASADALLIDELDKANTRDLPLVLQLADATRGLVAITKANKTYLLRLSIPIVAAMNIATNKRAQNWWGALKDRFVVVQIPQATTEEVLLFFMDEANTENEELLNLIRKYAPSMSLRKIKQIANYVRQTKPTPETLEQIIKWQLTT